MEHDIRSLENALFERWPKNGKPFVRDGVVDPLSWKNARTKILFLLKEFNAPDCLDDKDLRDFVSHGGRPPTWDNIARWT